MRYHLLGQTGLFVSELCLGTMTYGGGTGIWESIGSLQQEAVNEQVKFAVQAITKVMRLELVGKPIRVTEVSPGMVETEFSLVRFKGDAERAAKVYAGLQPLIAEDIADCIQWVVTRKPHVNIDEIVVKCLAQASATVNGSPSEAERSQEAA